MKALLAILLLAASSASAALPETAKTEDGRRVPPSINEDNLRGFVGAWRDPAEMLVRAQRAGDRNAEAALRQYADCAFMIVGIYVDRETTISSGSFVASCAGGKYTDLGIIPAKTRKIQPVDAIRLSPRDKQPIEVIIVFPAAVKADWLYGITRN